MTPQKQQDIMQLRTRDLYFVLTVEEDGIYYGTNIPHNDLVRYAEFIADNHRGFLDVEGQIKEVLK